MELFSNRPDDDGLPGRERGFAMAAVMTATAMGVFDGSVVNIALPQIAHSLNVSPASAVWVANGYLLSAAMTLAIFAALAARLGFRTLFAIGLSLFTLSSVGCALASSLPTLTGMRLLQGIGGAATLSIAPAILRTVFPGRLLGRILGLNALLIATSTAVAPLLGGIMLSALSWQWLFAINIPLGLIALALALRAIPGKTSDVNNAFGYGLTALIAGGLFIWRQRRAIAPLMPLEIFRSARFSLAALTSLASFVSQGMTFVALPFLFQSVYGYSAFASALLFLPWPAGIILVAPHAGRLADRYAPAIISTVGLCVFACGLVLLAQLPEHAQEWDIALRSLLCGIGFGCFQSPNNREMLANVARENSGYASGVLAIMRTFGQCLGTAFVGVILSLMAQPVLKNAIQEGLAVRFSLWVATGATMLALALSVSRLRNRRKQSSLPD